MSNRIIPARLSMYRNLYAPLPSRPVEHELMYQAISASRRTVSPGHRAYELMYQAIPTRSAQHAVDDGQPFRLKVDHLTNHAITTEHLQTVLQRNSNVLRNSKETRFVSTVTSFRHRPRFRFLNTSCNYTMVEVGVSRSAIMLLETFNCSRAISVQQGGQEEQI